MNEWINGMAWIEAHCSKLLFCRVAYTSVLVKQSSLILQVMATSRPRRSGVGLCVSRTRYSVSRWCCWCWPTLARSRPTCSATRTWTSAAARATASVDASSPAVADAVRRRPTTPTRRRPGRTGSTASGLEEATAPRRRVMWPSLTTSKTTMTRMTNRRSACRWRSPSACWPGSSSWAHCCLAFSKDGTGSRRPTAASLPEEVHQRVPRDFCLVSQSGLER